MAKPTIYGYWIGQDDIIEVPQWGHEATAYDILEAKHGISKSEVPNSAYDVMFFLGYVRVVNEAGEEGGHKAQHWTGAKHSKLQKEFLKDAEILDTWTLLESEIRQCKEVTKITD